MNTNKKLLLLGILFGVITLLAMQSLFSASAQPFQRPKPSPTPEVLENGWYRFTDSDAGYYFDYPPNVARISYGKDKGEKYNHVYIQFFGIEEYQSQAMIFVIKPNPRKLSTEEFLIEWYSKKTKKASQPSFSKEEMGEFFSVDGKPAIQTELIAKEPPTSYSFHVIFVNGDKAFIIGPSYGVMSASAVTPEAEELFTQILNTFRFSP